MALRVIAVDWSGALAGCKHKIWIAEASDGALVSLRSGLDREGAGDYLIERARETPELAIGLDFAFSLPAWFLREHGFEDARELWARADDCERWLTSCEPPFWGRPGKRRPLADEARPPLRRTDVDVPATSGIRPKSPFQIGGAGAVGTGSLRGMRLLHRLREAGVRIWPFDPPGLPLALEIYPRLFTGPVRKTQRQARLEILKRYQAGMTKALHAVAAESDDAFDAAVSAIEMSRHAAELAALPRSDDAELRMEGLIWHTEFGVRELAEAAAAHAAST